MELKASPNRLAEGTVIEAKIDKGRGPVATILIQQGTLNVGDSIVCGSAFGKVRAMFNDRGQRLHSSGPSVPVEILGLSDVPPAGEIFQAVADDKTARTEALDYSQEQRETSMARTRVSLEDIFKQMEESQVKELNLLLKSDVQGTTEALKQSLNKIKVQDIKVNIIHDGVGGINQSDVSLASASGAIIIGFNVRPDTQAQRLAEEEDVEIRLYRVIYDVIDDVRLALKGLLEPEFKEKVMGRVEVRNTFRHSKLGTIAGCYVIDGKVTNRALGRLLRDGVIIYEGKLSSLKRFKDDVKEVSSGYECGIMLENYNDIKEGDQIEAYAMVEEK
ncbi:MAG: translation initiation factor IF-2, partial [Eubacteriales bacterium]|nr:translation initiation factor IF-2 [Eubacteriales bacterium]